MTPTEIAKVIAKSRSSRIVRLVTSSISVRVKRAPLRRERRLLRSVEQEVLDHEVVHPRTHETGVASSGWQTTGSPRTLNDVLTSTGQPVWRSKNSLSKAWNREFGCSAHAFKFERSNRREVTAESIPNHVELPTPKSCCFGHCVRRRSCTCAALTAPAAPSMSEIPSIVPAHLILNRRPKGWVSVPWPTLAIRSSPRMAQGQERTSPVGILPNMFADDSQPSTPLASSFSRFLSRAGELRLVEQVSDSLFHHLAIDDGDRCRQRNMFGADLYTVPSVTALVNSTIAHHGF